MANQIKIVLAVAAAVVIAGAIGYWQVHKNKSAPSAKTDNASQIIDDEIAISPAGEAEEGEKEADMPTINNSKTLVVYFSRADENYNVGVVDEGNTAQIAKTIIAQTGADSFEIVPVTPYPENYQETVDLATAERNANARPDYQGDIDLSGYDTIFFGYPIWWGDLPMIVYNFVEKHDWQGKTVIPFNTHEGSGNSGTYQTLQSLMTGATLRGDGFNMTGTVARTEQGQTRTIEWLQGLDLE